MRFERQILLLRDQELFFSLEKVFESKTQEWESHYLALNSMSWRKSRVPREIEWKNIWEIQILWIFPFERGR